MTRERTILCGVYGVLAALGLVLTWSHNLAFVAGLEDAGPLEGFVAFWPALFVNHATSSITLDILVVATACSVFFVVEGRRVGIPHAWAFIPLALVVALAVSFPLFLLLRERALARAVSASGPDDPAAGAADPGGR